jgi:uncharacterized delta-60 repeat protein
MKARMNAFRLPIRELTFVAALTCLAGAPAQPVPKLDPNFKPAITRDGGFLSAAAAQSDGKIIVAGGFNAINGVARNGLARLNNDGSVDPAFDPGGGVCCGLAPGPTALSASVSAMAIQDDRRIVLGGSFSTVGGMSRPGLARLNVDGTLDLSFNPGSGLGAGPGTQGLAPVSALVVQPDGKLLVGGSFISVNGVARNGVARLNSNGSVDTGFDPGTGLLAALTSGWAVALALQTNGQVLVAGSFQYLSDAGRNGIGRLNADGSLDPYAPSLLQLQTGGPVSINGMAVYTNGSVVLSGSFDTLDSAWTRNGLARLKPDGTMDPNFDPNIDSASGESYTVLGLQADNKVIAFRQFIDATGSHRAIARLNVNGSLDQTFNLLYLEAGDAGSLQVAGVAPQVGGQWLVAGSLTTGAAPAHNGLARFDSAGHLDNLFNPRLEIAEGSASHVLAVAVQKDGKVLVGGTFDRVDGTNSSRLARLNRDGSLDAAFAPGVGVGGLAGFVSAILVQDDSRILIGGLFRTIKGASRNSIARLNTDGSLDSTFDVGSGTSAQDPSGQETVGRVSALALQADGKVIVAGDFSQLNGVPVAWLGRLNNDGSVDTSLQIGFRWPCDTCTTPDVRNVGVLSDGKIVIGGTFDRIEISFFNGLARLLTNGPVDPQFVPPVQATDEVTTLGVASDDRLVVALLTPNATGGASRGRLLRFNADGSSDSGFTPADVLGDGTPGAPISALGFDTAGRLLIGGQFASVGNTPRSGLARLLTDGSLDTAFDAGAGFAQGVFATPSALHARVTVIGFQDDGGIIVGGNFAAANNQVRLGLARFQAEPPTSRPVIRSWALATDGNFSLMISGDAGRTYRVQGSGDLRTWTELGNVPGGAAPQPFTDLTAKGLSARFYRVVGP